MTLRTASKPPTIALQGHHAGRDAWRGSLGAGTRISTPVRPYAPRDGGAPAPHPAHTEEFVLYHTEPVEASGFCIHYKLPHYVTFQSGLDALRAAGEEGRRESR